MLDFRQTPRRFAAIVPAFFFICSVPVIAQTWATPHFIGNGATTAVSTNGTGTSAVIFRETAGAIRAAVETGGTWGAPATLAANGQTADIAVAPNGDVLAVWALAIVSTGPQVYVSTAVIP